MTEAEIIKIFMTCENKDPKGVYPVEVDIIEFANKIEQHLNKLAKPTSIQLR